MKLTIGNKEYGLQWGLGAFEICCDRLGITLQELDYGVATGDQKILFSLAYSAMQNFAEINDNELDISYRKFQAWLDEAPEDTGAKIIESYMDSKYMGKTMKQHYDDLIERANASAKTTKKKTKSQQSPKQ